MYNVCHIWARQEIGKDAFWNHLMGINTILYLPWCVIGDFNKMECLSDKIGGTHLTLDLCVCILFWILLTERAFLL